VADPALPPEARAAFERGVAQFNAGLYFECHDTLEDLWSGLRGPDRDFVQGLIQVSVAFYHLGNGNTEGAASLFGRALARLAGYPPRHWGMDVHAQRLDLEARLARIEAGEPSPGELPWWRFEWREP
jgi:hypothetical protein